MTRASRVVRLGGSPDTQAAFDTVGMSWMSACIAFHERVGNLRQHDRICGMNLVYSVNRALPSGDRLQAVAALILQRDNTALRVLSLELRRDIQFVH